ncbi:UNVERIFIED_CONTAM: hypothetical protein PYX00_009786 [Menopon gallinae]|uniref:Lipase domain-containing protein n=1 Tax=Menopon gallinae TaxID=328185 RepID=A0AAW2HCM6_9NEOP
MEDDADGDEVTQKDSIFQPLLEVLLAEGCVDPPDSCPNENVTFWLYTSPTLIDISDVESLKNLKYGKGDPWKLIIHGYTGHKDYSPNSELRPAYFQKGEYNIISVDYNPLVREPCYVQSVLNVPLISNCTSQMIDTMIEEGIFRLEDLHVIGFSLGGQVSGQLSRFLKSGTLKRITGLDPALPLFIGNALGKLDASDAEFVDVIHTDAGRKGKLERSGHVDFYPNGGYSQIGCIDTENFTLSGCNHVRAAYYFAESINSDVGFWGIPCGTYVTFYLGFCKADEESLVLMGEYTPPT